MKVAGTERNNEHKKKISFRENELHIHAWKRAKIEDEMM